MITLKEFQERMNRHGWCMFPNFIEPGIINDLNKSLQFSLEKCEAIRKKNGIKNCEGTVHHILDQSLFIINLLCIFENLDPYLSSYFQGRYIINTMGGNVLTSDHSHANEIHRDIRMFSSDVPLMLNTILMLDDFTEENGATRIMSGGHKIKDKPSEDYFMRNSMSALGTSGSLLLFNSNMWHRAGVNKTNKPRRLISTVFSKPFIKQQMDCPRLMGMKDRKYFSSYLQQIIGYNSMTPSSLEEWYQPDDKRYYKKDN